MHAVKSTVCSACCPQLRGITDFQDVGLHTARAACQCRHRNTEQITEEFAFIVATTKNQDIVIIMTLELTRTAHSSMACACCYCRFNLQCRPCQTACNHSNKHCRPCQIACNHINNNCRPGQTACNHRNKHCIDIQQTSNACCCYYHHSKAC